MTRPQLSIQLFQTGRELADLGSLPSDKIIEDLTAARTDFVDLRNKLLDLANFLAISSLPEPDEILTLQDLRLLFYEAEQAEEKRAEVEQIRQGALRVLDRVLALVYRNSGDSSSFPPLAQCQAEAQELRHAVADACRPKLHPDAAALDEGKHKFAELLTLSEQWSNLDTGKFLLLTEMVKESFGPELSAEAGRGHLIIPEEATGTITPDVPEKGDEIARPIESPVSSAEFSDDIAPKVQMLPENARARMPPSAEMTQFLPEVRDRELQSSQKTLIEAPLSLNMSKEFKLTPTSDVLAPEQPSKPLPFRRLPEPGRNDLCLCGSGKKYKKCCQNAPRNDKWQEEQQAFAVPERVGDTPQKAQQASPVASLRIDPIHRGGGPRGRLPQSREGQGKQEKQLSRPKPEIVCWRREQGWMVAIEVPEEFAEQSDLKVLQNAECLVQDDFKEDCWLLQQAHGQVVLRWNNDEEPRETTLALCEQGYLLFKLSGQDLNQGRYVASLATGSYLVIVPETWECDEESSNASQVEPEFVSLDGYRAHFYTLEKGGLIIFRTLESNDPDKNQAAIAP